MSSDALIEHLDRALDDILCVRIELGGLDDVAVPDGGLDAALAADDNYQATRAALRDAVQAILQARLDDDLRGLVLKIEEVANHQVAVGIEVGWRLGLQAGWRRSGR